MQTLLFLVKHLAKQCDRTCSLSDILVQNLLEFPFLLAAHAVIRPFHFVNGRRRGVTFAPRANASSMSAHCCIIARRSGKYSARL